MGEDTMYRRKLLLAGSAGILSLGLAGIPAAAFGDGGGQTQPTVVQSGSSFTVTLPGIGSLSFSVDPSTDALTGLIVTPADPSITAGTPSFTDEGVQVLFTSATGSETLEVEVEGDGSMPKVTAEARGPEDGLEAENAAPGNEPENDNQNEAAPEVENETGDDQGTATSAPSVSGDSSGGSDSSDGQSGDTTTTVAPPSSTTTTTSVTSGDGGGSDGGSDGGSTTTSTSSSDGGGGSGDSSSSGSGQSSDG